MKFTTSRFASNLWMLGLTCGLVGCGGQYDASVSGVVSLDGNNLSRGTVTFNPKAAGSQAYGRINEQGEYTIRTGREEGLPAGAYNVTVVSNEAPTKQRDDGGPPPRGKPITPAWYKSPSMSGLEFTVEPGSNEINLELTSEPPPGWKPPKRRGRR